MSLRLDTPTASVPVATLDAYNRYWLPGAKALGLDLVPQFDSLFINPRNLDTLIDELSRLKEWMEQSTPPEVFAKLAPRIDAMLTALEPLRTSPGFTASVG